MRAILQQHRPSWHMRVARYSFSGSIPSLTINYVAINKHLEKLKTTKQSIFLRIQVRASSQTKGLTLRANKIFLFLPNFRNSVRKGKS